MYLYPNPINHKNMKERKCNLCKEKKPLSDFSNDSSRALGKSYRCKKCHHKEYKEKYYEKHLISRKGKYNEYYKGTTSITPSTNASYRKDSDLISAYWTLDNLDNRITSIHNSNPLTDGRGDVNKPLYIGNDNSVYDSEISVKSNLFNKMISSCIKFNDNNHIIYTNSVIFGDSNSNFTIQFWYKHTSEGSFNLLLESIFSVG